MKTYQIKRMAHGVECTVHREGMLPPYRLPHHILHSPNGFEFGYGGSGPAELARCILLNFFDAFLTDDLARKEAHRLHQDFKWAFIANQTDVVWFIITEKEISNWLTKTEEGK